MIIDHSYDHTPKLSSASIILWIKHELKYEIWIKYGFWSKSQNLINYLYFSEGHKPNRQQYCTIFMIVQRSCYCRTLAKGVEEKRGVCGKCGGISFPPHQHIPSNQFTELPKLPVTIPFFLEKAVAHIEPLLTLWGKERCINGKRGALFPSSNQRTSTDLTAGAHLFRQGIPIYSVTQLHHNSPPHDVGITSQSDYTKWVMSIEYWELNN